MNDLVSLTSHHEADRVIVGIAVRTSLSDAAKDIPATWERFFREGRLHWYLDQCALFSAHAVCRNQGVRFAYLPPALAHLAGPGAAAFAPAQAVVWSAIASLVEKEPLFSSRPFTDYLV